MSEDDLRPNTVVGVDPALVPSVRLDVRIRNVGGTLLVGVPQHTFELSEVAAFLWRRIDGRRTFRQLGELLAEEYGVDTDTATADTLELLADLIEHGAVTIPGPPSVRSQP